VERNNEKYGIKESIYFLEGAYRGALGEINKNADRSILDTWLEAMSTLFLMIITKSGERKASLCTNRGLMSFLISIENLIALQVEKLINVFLCHDNNFIWRRKRNLLR